MNTKNNLNTNIIFNLLLAVAFLAAVLGCGSSNTSQPNANQTVNSNAAPQNTLVVNSPTPTPTPNNPTAAFAGVWETKYDISNIIPGYPASNFGTSGQFAEWRFSEGVKTGDQYVGKITNALNNENIAEYTVVSKTITVKFLPVSIGTTQTTGTSRDYEYEIADNGNMLTLKGRDPILLTKGTGNTEMENVSFVISNKVDWIIRPPKTVDPSKPDAFFITFETAQKFDNGYRGKMEYWNEDPYNPSVLPTVVATGEYLLTSKDKMTITLGGPKSATYKLIDNRVLQIDFTDPNESDMVLTAR